MGAFCLANGLAKGTKMIEQKTVFSSVADELREAYRSAHFNVLEPSPFTLRIGEASQELAGLYRDYNISTAAFLTAWNPYSETTAQHANEFAQNQLQLKLDKFAAAVLSAIGEDASGRWPGEPSVLALGISREQAIRLGNDFRQNALVWIDADYVPELVFLTIVS